MAKFLAKLNYPSLLRVRQFQETHRLMKVSGSINKIYETVIKLRTLNLLHLCRPKQNFRISVPLQKNVSNKELCTLQAI
jgi:hypothetical protein